MAVELSSSLCPRANSSFVGTFVFVDATIHNCGAVSQRVLSFRSCSYLGSENGRLDELQRAAIDLDQTLSGLGVGDSLIISINSQHFCYILLMLNRRIRNRWAWALGD